MVEVFRQTSSPLLKKNFLLATSDSDSCVPSETMPEARQLLQSNKVLHWYAQNYDGTLNSKKISPLPIGIDFHTLSERPVWGQSVTTPLQQECELVSIAAQLPKCTERLGSVYVDFAWQQGLGLRNYRRFHPLKGTKFHESSAALPINFGKCPRYIVRAALCPDLRCGGKEANMFLSSAPTVWDSTVIERGNLWPWDISFWCPPVLWIRSTKVFLSFH